MSSSWYASVRVKNYLWYLIWEWGYNVWFPGMRWYESKFGRHFILFDVVPNSYFVGLWYASVWMKNDLCYLIWEWSYSVRFPGMRCYESKNLVGIYLIWRGAYCLFGGTFVCVGMNEKWSLLLNMTMKLLAEVPWYALVWKKTYNSWYATVWMRKFWPQEVFLS